MGTVRALRGINEARDATAACQAAVDALAAVPGLLPSAYLERGGRLRCHAVSGYWQVRDGIPPGTGVIGEVFRTGRASIVTGTGPLDAGYLPAAEAVMAEIALPLRCDGVVVGVLNVEAQRPITVDETTLVQEVRAALTDRICALGGPPAESAPQRLVRHAATLAEQHDEASVEAALLVAAIDVMELDSAMLLRLRADDPVRPGPVLGPLGEELRDAGERVLGAVAAYVVDGTSAYSVAARDGDATAGVQLLRAVGVGALAAVPVDPERVLLVAGRATTPPATDDIELLELLALQAAVALRTVGSVRALRVQAASDPLTGLGHHRTFHQALAARSAASASAVVVADIDGFKAFNDAHGHQAGDRLLRELATALSAVLRRNDMLYRIGGDEFAALLQVSGPQEALDVGRRMHRAVAGSDLGVTISVGVAVPEPGESETDTLGRADRALYEVKAAGRDGVRLACVTAVTAPAPGRR